MWRSRTRSASAVTTSVSPCASSGTSTHGPRRRTPRGSGVPDSTTGGLRGPRGLVPENANIGPAPAIVVQGFRLQRLIHPPILPLEKPVPCAGLAHDRGTCCRTADSPDGSQAHSDRGEGSRGCPPDE